MVWLTVTLLAGVITLLYVYLVWNFNYWKKRNIPGPDPTPLLGTMPSAVTQKRNLYYEFSEIYKKYKGDPFVGVFLLRAPQILAIEPEFIKEILIKNFKSFHDNDFSNMVFNETDPLFGRNPFVLTGEEWKEKRGQITPAFTPARLKALFPLIEDVCERMTKYLTIECATKPIGGFDGRELAAKFTVDVVAKCAYGVEANSFDEADAFIRKMGTGITSFGTMTFVHLAVTSVFPILRNFWKNSLVPKNINQFFIQLTKDSIDYRLNSNIDRADYLNYLIQLKQQKNVENIDLAAHGISFFVDGFDTSSLVMAHTLYELGRNVEAQTKLRVKINEHEKADFDLLNEMPYLNQVVYEALRMHPPGAYLSRMCTEPIELNGGKDKKVLIEKGIIVNIPIYSLHRDADYYENPDEFYPERFDQENGGIKAFRDKGVLMPFGDGPRMCLGMKFAVLQVKAGIFEIIKHFRVSVNKKTQEPLVLKPSEILTIPIGGIWLDFEKV